MPALMLLMATGALGAGLAGTLAAAAYLLAAEILAVLGSATEVALERHSRSRVMALAEARGIEEQTARRFTLLPTFELTARLVRFLGHAFLVTGIAYLAFHGRLPADGTGAIPWSTFGVLLAIMFAVTFLVNGVLVRLLVARRANRVLLAALPYLGVMRWVTFPLRLPLVLIVKLLFRVDLDAAAPSPREEILETVEEGEREGSFTPEEADMIESIIEMERSLVKDVLTPRADVIMIQAEASLDEAVRVCLEEGYSRVPVYGKDRDDVIGVLYAHDLLAHWGDGGTASDTPPCVRDLMRPPFFVPENKSLNDLLKEMRARKVHMAVVLDEFNGTEGLVTIEDLLEEIVGEIEDEYDDPSDESSPTEEEKAAGMFRVEGRTPIDEVNARYEIELPVEEDFETLGGLVFHRLGKVPAPGDRVEISNVIITVVEADERTAHSLLLRVLPEEAEESAEDESAA
jgi:putative hemolysin